LDSGSEVEFVFVILLIVSVAAVFCASAHVPLLLASGIVTAGVETESVPAVQLEKPEPSVTTVPPSITKVLGKVTLIVPAAASAPPTWKLVNPTVHVDVAWLTFEPGEKVTDERPMTIAEEVAAAVLSDVVLTVKPLAAYVAAVEGLTILARVNVPEVLAARVQPVGRGNVAFCPLTVTVGGGVVQAVPPENPAVRATVGAPVRLNPVGKVAVIVSLAAATMVGVVNTTVHVGVALGIVLVVLNATEDGVAALAIVAVPKSTIAMTMAPAVNLLMR
jgi:hypothetical protein